MREILFRGKNNYGRWFEGSLVCKTDSLYGIKMYSIVTQDHGEKGLLNPTLTWYPVIPETVGQYTGLNDKNGKRIFEGDIIKESHWLKRTFKVEFDEGRGGWYPFACGDGCGCCEDEVVAADWCEVIGNVHDHPELIAEVEGC